MMHINCFEDKRAVYTDKTDKDNPKQYRVLHNLASGRYGDVQKVELITNHDDDEENERNEQNDEQKETELMDNVYALKSQEVFNGEITDKLQREIDIMLKLKNNNNNNNNIMLMINYFIDDDYLLFLLPFFDSNLECLLKTAPLKMDLISNIMYQILNGLSYIHSLNIIHRDIKPNNILYCTASQKIVIADFGSARDITLILENDKKNDDKEENKMSDKLIGFDNPNWNGFDDMNENKEYMLSPQIYIVQYRAPELLVGERNYRFGVDIWSIGCIMAQMTQKNGKLLFDKDHDIPLFMQQLQILGGPKKYELDGVGLFSAFFQIEYQEYNPMNKIIDNKNLNQSGCDLLAKMLTFGPKQRITAKQALSHPFFEKINNTKK